MENPRLLQKDGNPVNIDCSTVSKLVFHEKLNVIIVAKNNGISVIDPTIDEIVCVSNPVKYAEEKCNPSSAGEATPGCSKSQMNDNAIHLAIAGDKLVLIHNDYVGIRSEYNGCFLLESMLQAHVSDKSDMISLEISKAEADGIVQYLSSITNDHTALELEKHLKTKLAGLADDQSLLKTKKEKWQTVTIELPPYQLKSVLVSILEKLKEMNTSFPAPLAIICSLLERLELLMCPKVSVLQEKAKMASELARKKSFKNWPHTDYKWALPSKMAQTGFYHEARKDEDIALCFACSVCLISWEPSDEPWSEHERHSPFCPFLRGENTLNAPLNAVVGSAPAIKIAEDGVLGTSHVSHCFIENAVIVCFKDGLVAFIDATDVPKVKDTFKVSVADVSLGSSGMHYCLSDLHLKPKDAMIMEWSPSANDDFPLSPPDTGLKQAISITSKQVSQDLIVTIESSAAFGAKCWDPEFDSGPNSLSLAIGGTLHLQVEEECGKSGVFCSNWTEKKPFISLYDVGYCSWKGDKENSDSSLPPDVKKETVEECDSCGSSVSKFEQDLYECSEFDGLQDPYFAEQLDDYPMAETNEILNETETLAEELLKYSYVMASGNIGASTPKKLNQKSAAPKKPKANSKKKFTIKLIQKVELPHHFHHCTHVRHVISNRDGTRLLVNIASKVVPKSAHDPAGVLLLYDILKDEENHHVLSKQPISFRVQRSLVDVVRDISLISGTGDNDESFVACCLFKGEVEIYKFSDLTCVARIVHGDPDVTFISSTYCQSLDRLYCSTNKETIEPYRFTGSMAEELPNHQFDNQGANPDYNDIDEKCLLINQKLDHIDTLTELLSLTKLDSSRPSFSANAPTCWVKVLQATKDIKGPISLKCPSGEFEPEVSSISWRYQKSKVQKLEHLFEIALSRSTQVAHFELRFQLHSEVNSPPNANVTLYKANPRQKDWKSVHEVDDKINFVQSLHQGPNSKNFLKSINAEVVCGPIVLAAHVDLTGQNGNIVLTSPSLVITRGKLYYILVQLFNESDKCFTKSTKALSRSLIPNPEILKYRPYEAHGKSSKGTASKPLRYSDSMKQKISSSFSAFNPTNSTKSFKSSDSSKSNKEVVSFEVIREVSILVSQSKLQLDPKTASLQRAALVNSDAFVEKVFESILFDSSQNKSFRKAYMDILIWLATIRLCGPPLEDEFSRNSSTQKSFLKIVHPYLHSILLKGILLAERTMAHKCSKFLVLCIDNLELYHDEEPEGTGFIEQMVEHLTELLPVTLSCQSAGSMQWFFLLLNRIRCFNLKRCGHKVMDLLRVVAKELENRNDSFTSLLRTRFGLYGNPFEDELFEIELPSFSKSHASPLTYAGVAGIESMNEASGYSWGLKDIDFRDLLSTAGSKLSSGSILGVLSPKQLVQGLLDVEPLHFRCQSASSGTRVERLSLDQSMSYSTLTVPPLAELIQYSVLGDVNDAGLSKSYKIFMIQNSMDKIAYEDHMETSSEQIPYPHESFHPSVGSIDEEAQDEQKSNLIKYLKMFASTKAIGSLVHDTAKKAVKSSMPHPSKASSSKSRVTVPIDHTSQTLVSPWHHLLSPPTPQSIVIERMQSGAKKHVILDFGSPILLTDIIFPPCSDLASLTIDTWVRHEEKDCQRLVVATDIENKALIVSDLQPPPVCRFVKIIMIGRYCMTVSKCRVPLGLFYGHSCILKTDLAPDERVPEGVQILSETSCENQLSMLHYMMEDIRCRYQLASNKLRKHLEPLLKANESSKYMDSVSYYLPKGKEKNSFHADALEHDIVCDFKECIKLQQQLNIARGIINRLETFISPPEKKQSNDVLNPKYLLSVACTNKIHLLTEYLLESLLGISYLSSPDSSFLQPSSTLLDLSEVECESLFRNICVMENSQVQVSFCAFILRTCGFQPWWGRFLASCLKNLFSSSSQSMFPQDRVFLLLLYLGQRSMQMGQNASVMENLCFLLDQVLSEIDSEEFDDSSYLGTVVDMKLLGWLLLYISICLDTMKIKNVEDVKSMGKPEMKSEKSENWFSSRWDFIQSEKCFSTRTCDESNKTLGPTAMKRRNAKKELITGTKFHDFDTGGSSDPPKVAAKATSVAMEGNSLSAEYGSSGSHKPGFAPGLGLGQSSSFENDIEFKNGVPSKSYLFHCKQFMDIHNNRKERMNKSTTFSRLSSSGKSSIPMSFLSYSVCFKVSQKLVQLILKVDSTCSSDVILVACKTLARIATSCRPIVTLGSIFKTQKALLKLITTAIDKGIGCNSSLQESSGWIYHAIVCLLKDLMEAEKVTGNSSTGSMVIPKCATSDNNDEAGHIDEVVEDLIDAMDNQIKAIDNEISEAQALSLNTVMNQIHMVHDMESTMDLFTTGESDDSDGEILKVMEQVLQPPSSNRSKRGSARRSTNDAKLVLSYSSSLSAALDARLYEKIESCSEIRLRMMAVVDSEFLCQSLNAPNKAPIEFLKNVNNTSSSAYGKDCSDAVPTVQLVSKTFEALLSGLEKQPEPAPVCRILSFWLNFNFNKQADTTDSFYMPNIPSSSFNCIVNALVKFGDLLSVEEWGIGLQCLCVILKSLSTEEIPVADISSLFDDNLKDLIMKFLRGFGESTNYNKIPAVGPTVSNYFYAFLYKLFNLTTDVEWRNCVGEMLLQVLDAFLAGPLLYSEFPIDAFHKLLDILSSHQGYGNPQTVLNVFHNFAKVLHVFTFVPEKIAVRTNMENKPLQKEFEPKDYFKKFTPTELLFVDSSCDKLGKTLNFDHLMYRIVFLMTNLTKSPYQTAPVRDCLKKFVVCPEPAEPECSLAHCLAKCDLDNPDSIADICVQLDRAMNKIYNVLAHNNRIRVLTGDNYDTAFTMMERSHPVNVVESVIALGLSLIKSCTQSEWVVLPLFEFLSNTACPIFVSETFILIVLRLLRCEKNLAQFIAMNCVESVCKKMISCSKKLSNTSLSFVSVLSNYISKYDDLTPQAEHKKSHNEILLEDENFINVAPYATISVLNSSESADGLLEMAPPHRRVRTPPWSHVFFSDCYVEMLLTLPCAMMLKEIQIVPHVNSTSPSAVTVELTMDLSHPFSPVGLPMQCSSTSCINLRFEERKIAKSVLLRLYKPKDSSTLSLCQIRIFGSSSFMNSEISSQISTAKSETVQTLDASSRWMYILEYAILIARQIKDRGNEQVFRMIQSSILSIPGFIESCYSLLICPVSNQKNSNFYLLRLCSFLHNLSQDSDVISNRILQALLGPVQKGLISGLANNQIGSLANAKEGACVELLFHLCSSSSNSGFQNLSHVLKWIHNVAQECVKPNGSMSSWNVIPGFVQSTAAALWFMKEELLERKDESFRSLVHSDLLRDLFLWTTRLEDDVTLKKSLNNLMLSVCNARPSLFVYFMYIAELIRPVDHLKHTLSELSHEELCSQFEVWMQENALMKNLQLISLSELQNVSTSVLLTLACLSKSPATSEVLLQTSLLSAFNTAIEGFLNLYLYSETSWAKGVNSAQKDFSGSQFMVNIMKFCFHVCDVRKFKTWFGVNGSQLWFPLLNFLSVTSGSVKCSLFGNKINELEDSIMVFLLKCISGHSANKHLLANCLKDIIEEQKVPNNKAVFLHSLSSFARRLILQLLLDHEKVLIHVKNHTKLTLSRLGSFVLLEDRHPSYGVNARDQIFYAPIYSNLGQLMQTLDSNSKENEFERKKASSLPLIDDKLKTEILSSSELKTIDQIQLAMSGIAAKDKRLSHLSSKIYPKKSSVIASGKFAPKKSRSERVQECHYSSSAGTSSRSYSSTPVYSFECFQDDEGKKLVPRTADISSVYHSLHDPDDKFLDTVAITFKSVSPKKGRRNDRPAPKDDEKMDVDSVVETEQQNQKDTKSHNNRLLIDMFADLGGLAIIARRLPLVYMDLMGRSTKVGSTSSNQSTTDKESPSLSDDWVTFEIGEEPCDDPMDVPVPNKRAGLFSKNSSFNLVPHIPPHSIMAFTMFLMLPNYATVLLEDKTGAFCLLRLAMGVTDDADGNEIFWLPECKSLPTLPFIVLQKLLNRFGLNTEKGKMIREAMIDMNVVHFLLSMLAIFTHQECDPSLIKGPQYEFILAAKKAQLSDYSTTTSTKSSRSDDKSHLYWAKGTGFGTGSTTQSWDIETSFQWKRQEEENVEWILNILSSYVSPWLQTDANDEETNGDGAEEILPSDVESILRKSCLLPSLSNYLGNDSVLDMARHVPLYQAVLRFLKSLASCPQLLSLLLPSPDHQCNMTAYSLSYLLDRMKSVVNSYSKRLVTNLSSKGGRSNGQKSSSDDLDDEDLASLISQINEAATFVADALKKIKNSEDIEMKSVDEISSKEMPANIEDLYLKEMKKLQFDFYEMIVEDAESTGGIRLTVPYHFEGNLKQRWASSLQTVHQKRLKRLAQESVTLSTSLPIAYGSTIFVRCDTDRLDVMKVLITGPAMTPYSNGCFEFDIFFPPEYPNYPMTVHLRTTGHQKIRFNPNLYADGKVCLSILNTWHGRPEEKWNPKTSSLLPVLVAIQSLILNAEPYFNEPGFEKSRGKESGERSSREYNSKIQISTVEWAMLDQIRNPSPCFKEVIHKHFWIKRTEIIEQCEKWLEEQIDTFKKDKKSGKTSIQNSTDPVSLFKNKIAILKKELLNMKKPEGLETTQLPKDKEEPEPKDP